MDSEHDTPQDGPEPDGHQPSRLVRTIERFVKVKHHEVAVMLWSFVYFFLLLSSHYILRPLRDQKATESGVDNLKWLFLATLGAMLVASPLFSALVTRYTRRRFIPYVYRFFALNLVVFFVLMKTIDDPIIVGRMFYVWMAVFALFVVSVFWGFMADIFSNRQGKRLFGSIAVGGTLGQICASTFNLHYEWDVDYLPLISVVLLEGCCRCVGKLNRLTGGPRWQREPTKSTHDEAPALASRGSFLAGAFEGIGKVIRSRYLLGICLFVFCYSLTSTLLYVTKIDISSDLKLKRNELVQFFALIDLVTGILTILVQIFLTSRLMSSLGVGRTLAVLPLVTLVGFAALGLALRRPEMMSPVWTLVAFEAIRRASNYGISRPAREVLFTVVSREEKYKSKNFIDTFVYRAGDQVGVWGRHVLKNVAHLGSAGAAFAAVPLAAGWLVVGLLLGTAQGKRADQQAAEYPRIDDDPGEAPASA